MKTPLFFLIFLSLGFTSCLDLLLSDYPSGNSSGYRCPTNTVSTTNSNPTNNETCELDYTGPGEVIWSRILEDVTTYKAPIFLHQKDGVIYLADRVFEGYSRTKFVAIDMADGTEIYTKRLDDILLSQSHISEQIYFEENIFWTVGKEYLRKYDLNSAEVLNEFKYEKKYAEVFRVEDKFIGAEIVACEADNFIKLYELGIGIKATTLLTTIPLGDHVNGRIWFAGVSKLKKEQALYVVQEKGQGTKSHKLCSVDLSNNTLAWTTEVTLDLNWYSSNLFNLAGQTLAIKSQDEIAVFDLSRKGKLRYTIPHSDIKEHSKIFSVGSDFLFVNGRESGVRFQKDSGAEIFRAVGNRSERYFRFTAYHLVGETLFVSNDQDGFISFDVNSLQEIEKIPGPHAHCDLYGMTDFHGHFGVSSNQDELIVNDIYGSYRIKLD